MKKNWKSNYLLLVALTYVLNYIPLNAAEHFNNKEYNIDLKVAKLIGEKSKYFFLIKNNSKETIYIYPFFVGDNKLLAKWEGQNNFKQITWIKKKFPRNYMGIAVLPGKELKRIVNLSEYIGENAHLKHLRNLPSGLITIQWQIFIKDGVNKFKKLTHLFYLYKE